MCSQGRCALAMTAMPEELSGRASSRPFDGSPSSADTVRRGPTGHDLSINRRLWPPILKSAVTPASLQKPMPI